MRLKLTLIASLFAALCCWSASAQDDTVELPQFKQDKIYKNGKLANGINYFFASNSTQKGLLDIALIQKLDSRISEEELADIATTNFFKVNALTSSFRSFLTRNGIGPAEKGYFAVTKGSICYRFDDLSSAMPESVMDSTLLAIFELARLHAKLDEPTDAQAIVIAGDFDQKVFLSKLKLLSMITPRAEGAVPELEYQWDSLRIPKGITTTVDGALAKLETVWLNPRTPEKYMRTALPVVSDKLAGELGCVLRRRLESVFALNKVNCWVEFSHINSSKTAFDEQTRFTVNCMASDAPLVEDIMEREMSRLYTWGIDPVEYSYARDIYRHIWTKRCNSQITSNHTLCGNCVSAFLYDAPLASEQDKINFAYREMPLEQQTELFNNYMKRLLCNNVQENTSLTHIPYLMQREEIAALLDKAAGAYAVKLPKERTDLVTGGLMWTLGTNVNLIHKSMPCKGITYFSFAAKGGRHGMENARISSVDGIEDDVMDSYLRANGIDVSATLTPYEVLLQGSVPDENLGVLLKYLCAVVANPVNNIVFGDNTYKLMVLVSGKSGEEVGKMVAKVAGGLGKGSTWIAGRHVDEPTDNFEQMRGFITFESSFPLDHTGGNKALADVASYALGDALLKKFRDTAVYVRDWSSYPLYPFNHYRLMFGVCRFKTLSALAPLDNLSNEQIQERLRETVLELASTPVSKEMLAKYKGLAKNAQLSLEGTAFYYINSANDRYLSNKNFWARYPQLVDGVSAEAIMKFYDSATTPNR